MQPIELLPIEIYLSIGKVLHARQQRIAQSHLSHGHGICDGASRPREKGQVRDLKGMAPISQQPTAPADQSRIYFSHVRI
jgi:hypothetical protein